MRNTSSPTPAVRYPKEPADSAHLLSRYVQFPSLSGNEEEAGRFFARECSKAGLYVHFFTKGKGQLNFAASLYPLEKAKPNIVFLNHIDVVDPGDEREWQYPPFSGEIAEGFVWGRGAYDNKGPAIIQFAAVKEFVALAKTRDLPYNVTLLSVSGEEVFSELGAKQIAGRYLDLLNPVLVIGEGPVGLKGLLPQNQNQWFFGISNANKRVLWLNLEIKVDAHGHGSVPPRDHALIAMIAALSRIAKSKPSIKLNETAFSNLKALGNYLPGWKGWILKNARYFKYPIKWFLALDPVLAPFYSDTTLVSTLETEDKAHNIISKKVSARLDCRLLPQTDTQTFITALKQKMQDPRIEIFVEKETPNAQPSDVNHPFFSDLAAAIKSEFQGAAVFPVMLPNTSDCNAFRNKGIPVFSTVPVKLSKELIDCIHGPNERIPIAALEEGKRVFIGLLKNVLSKA